MLPEIKFTVERDPKVLKAREWTKMLKLVWFRVGMFWHKFILPKHFTKRGAAEYKYPKRQGEVYTGERGGWSRTYHSKKLKSKHHGHPLTFTGELKKAALGLVDIRATGNGANIYLRGLPPHVNMRVSENSPNMRAELTALSNKDIDTLVRFGDKQIDRELKRIAGGTSSLSLT